MADFAIERSGVLGDVAHGFFGHGGPHHPRAHQFGFGGPGDEAEVARIRATAADALVAGAQLMMPHQTHSPDVVTVTEPWPDEATGRPPCDALVTSLKGVVIGIVTADCAPVLFADKVAGVVGAAHAGWRGAQGGVLENTLDAMEALGSSRGNIAAAIGPTIGQASYEVDAPFRAHFTADDDAHFAPAPDREGTPRWHFDLPGYIVEKLHKLGCRKIESLGRDTFALSERYYSYRMASQRGEPNYGRQISLIGLD
jgi:YfiH family protein